MNKTECFSAIIAALQDAQFGAYLRPNWYDSERGGSGFLRVAIEEGDDRLTLYRFDRREILLWSIDLHICVPQAILWATLDAALSDAGISVELPR